MLLLWAVCFLSRCHRAPLLLLLALQLPPAANRLVPPPTTLSRTREVEARRRAKRDRDLAEQLEQVRVGSGVRPPIFPASPHEAVETQPRDQ